jgi:flavorubredoxin
MEPYVTVTELVPDVFRIGMYHGAANENVSCFVIRDELPAMIDTHFRRTFPVVRDAVAKVLDPSTLRYLFVTTANADSSGGVNGFLDLAPEAEVLCSPLAKLSGNDLFSRPPREVRHGERISLGRRSMLAVQTPWAPTWDAMQFYDETDGLLFATDVFISQASAEPVTSEDQSDKMLALVRRAGIFPSAAHLEQALQRFEKLDVRMLCSMHGPCLAGDPKRYYDALRGPDVAGILDAPLYSNMDFEVKLG